jgi:putative RecB family exonuclease
MPVWSHSRLQAFRQCPRKFFYRYVQRVKLPEEPETIEQFVGSRAHDALEWLYEEVQGGRTPSAADVLAKLDAAWDDEWHDGITMPAGERPSGDHREEARRWLADYHERHAPFTDARVMGLERRITFALDEAGGVKMQGVIDRLSRAVDGTWQIHDYKTSRSLPTQAEKDADPQLAYYEMGVRRMWPGQVERVELTWHFLKFGVAITSRRSEEQLAAVREAALVTVRDAGSRPRAEAAFPPVESKLCRWCEYQSICPVRKHLVAAATLTADRFANEPGVALVDRWTALEVERSGLKSRLEGLESDIEQLKQALAAYARREGVEVVTGSEREATVRAGEMAVFPRKTVAEEEDEAAALERQLRDSRWWREASMLDRAALGRLWARRDALESDLRALLEEFVRVESRVDVRLRKPRD